MAKRSCCGLTVFYVKKNYKIVKVIKIKLFKKLPQRIQGDSFMIIIV